VNHQRNKHNIARTNPVGYCVPPAALVFFGVFGVKKKHLGALQFFYIFSFVKISSLTALPHLGHVRSSNQSRVLVMQRLAALAALLFRPV
jgi:hypothetical protein